MSGDATRRPSTGRWATVGAWVQAACMVGLTGLAAGSRGGRRAAAPAAAVAGAVAVPYARAVARHQPYPASARGILLWLVDSTWSAPNTLAGAAFHGVEARRRNPARPERSRGSGTICLERSAIAGYATTVGVVKAGSHPGVDAHEDVHVLQARLLGPLYLPFVALGFVVATVAPVWWWRHDHDAAPIDTLRAYFHRGVYRNVWHERWAYAVAPTRGDRPAAQGV